MIRLSARLMISLLLLAPGLLPAQEVTIDVGVQEKGFYPRAMTHRIPAPMSGARHFTVHGLSLYAIQEASGGAPLMHRLEISPSMDGEVPEELPVSGVPRGFLPTALESNTLGSYLLLGGEDATGKVRTFRSRTDENGVPGQWEPLPEFPKSAGGVVSIRDSGAWALFITRNDSGYSGWGGNVAGDLDALVWVPLSAPPEARDNPAFLVSRDAVLMVGGTAPSGNPARQVIGLNYSLPTFFNWEDKSLGLPIRIPDAIGTSYGGGLFMASRSPLQYETADAPTSGTILSSYQRPSGSFTAWRENAIVDAPAPLRAVLIEPAHPWLLTLAELEGTDDLVLSAHRIPAAFVGRGQTQEELELALFEKVAVDPQRIPADEVMRLAADNNQLALLVVTGGDRREDLELRVKMRGSRYRYLTQNTQQTYLSGEEGDRVRRQFGVKTTPALLLVTPDGKVVSRHEGSVPSASQLFELTTPTRSPERPAVP